MRTIKHRIVYLIESLNVGGAERALLRLAKVAKQRGHNPQIWVYREKGSLLSDFLDARIPVFDCSNWNWHPMGWGSKRSVLQSVLSLQVSRPTVFHSFSWLGDRSEPISVSLSGIQGYIIRLASAEPMGLPEAWELKYALADRIVVLTESARSRLLDRRPNLESRVRVIPNGVDTNLFAPIHQQSKKVFKQKLGLKEESFVITSVARLHAQKNQVGLIQAFGELCSRTTKDTYLWLIGTGPDRQQLEKLVAEMNLTSRVFFLGTQPDVYPFVSASDLFVLLSRPPSEGGVESMSNALLEAMSCGVPAIVSRCGTEEVVTDGQDGFVVSWDNHEMIVDRLTQMTDKIDTWKMFGAKARLKILHKYTLTRTVEANLMIYEELARRHNGIARLSTFGRIQLGRIPHWFRSRLYFP